MDYPTELQHRAIDMAKQDQEHTRRIAMIMEVLKWYHAAYRESDHPDAHSFRMTLLQYFWDEWLTMDDQREMVSYGGEGVMECIQENQYQFGRTLVQRYLDPKTGAIVFECEGGELCPPSYIEEIQADREDVMQQLVVSRHTTGPLYAALVPKHGSQLVMKTFAPPLSEGAKVERGKQCDIVSNTKEHLQHLHQLGAILQDVGRSDWGLTRVSLLNSARLCTLTNLVLRMMDIESIHGKRWFYRPVAASYTGHKGTFREQLEKKRAKPVV
jgi:hypothetical protein